MKFAEPLWLLAGLVACSLLVWGFYLSGCTRRRMLEQFAATHLLPQLTASISPQLRLIKQILWVLAVAALFTALARPQWGFYWQEVKRRGIDILIAVDTSKSMLAQDVKPDRLTRAKLAVNDLVDQLGGDRVGLIAFAGEAFLQCPLTLDHTAFIESLQALDTTIIPLGGTDVASAIHEAQAAFVNEGQNHKILVLITDGEDLEGRALDTARAAAKDGVKIYTVGVGSSTGELIPVPDEKGGVSFAKDENGNFVKSRLDENMLRQIAESTGGSYEPIGADGQGLINIYNRDLKTLPQYDLKSRQQRVYYERFQWPLGLALALLMIELLLIERRAPVRRQLESRDIRPKLALSRRAAAPMVLALLLIAVGGAQASTGSAETAYKKGQYAVALKDYSVAGAKDPERPELQYNIGASAYKLGQWNEAAQAFQKALSAKDPQIVERASYNLGNTLYRVGQETEKSNPQQTISSWEQSVQAYEGALRIKSDDADAKYNRDYVKKKLDELKKKQPPQQNKQDQKQDQQQNQDQKNQDKNQSNSNQNQNQNQQDKDKDKDKNSDKNNQQNPSNQQNNSGNKPDDKKDSNKDQSGQNGQKPDDKKQPSQPENKPGQQPDQQPSNSQQPQQPKSGDDGSDEQRPGQMSKAEARNLLDSAKGDEKKVQLLQGKQNDKAEQRDVKKDW